MIWKCKANVCKAFFVDTVPMLSQQSTLCSLKAFFQQSSSINSFFLKRCWDNFFCLDQTQDRLPDSLAGDAGGGCVGDAEQAPLLRLQPPPGPGASASLCGPGPASEVSSWPGRSDPAPEVTGNLSPQHSPHPDPAETEARASSRSPQSQITMLMLALSKPSHSQSQSCVKVKWSPDLRRVHYQDTQAPSDTEASLTTTLMTIPTISPDHQKSLNTALGKTYH